MRCERGKGEVRGDEFVEKSSRRFVGVIGGGVHTVYEQLFSCYAVGGVIILSRDSQRKRQHEGEHRRHDANHNL